MDKWWAGDRRQEETGEGVYRGQHMQGDLI